jgi:hypothetical protein
MISRKARSGKVLGPEGQAENVKFALRQVEPHGLAAVDADPGNTVVTEQEGPAGKHAQALVEALDLAGVDFSRF